MGVEEEVQGVSCGGLFDGGGAAAGVHRRPYYASSPALADRDRGGRCLRPRRNRGGGGAANRDGSDGVFSGGGGGSGGAANNDRSDGFFSSCGGGSDGNEDDARNPRKRKKRHLTPDQIQQLEALFKENSHPDDRKCADVSKCLGLELSQVKVWFQNRRAKDKRQIKLDENVVLMQKIDKLCAENESLKLQFHKLQADNMVIREAMKKPLCSSCSGLAVPVDLSLENHQLHAENMRLNEKLTHVLTLTAMFLGKPVPDPSHGGGADSNTQVCSPRPSSIKTQEVRTTI